MSAALPRFMKLDDADQTLPESAADWVSVHDMQTGLIWAAASIKVSSWNVAMKKAAAFSQGGHEWRAPTRNELFTLTDVERRDPAIDTAFFPDTKSDWYWSSSPVVGWPEYAWLVDFDDGLVSLYLRDYSGFVRPVRVARPRQSSAIGESAITQPAVREAA